MRGRQGVPTEVPTEVPRTGSSNFLTDLVGRTHDVFSHVIERVGSPARLANTPSSAPTLGIPPQVLILPEPVGEFSVSNHFSKQKASFLSRFKTKRASFETVYSNVSIVNANTKLSSHTGKKGKSKKFTLPLNDAMLVVTDQECWKLFVGKCREHYDKASGFRRNIFTKQEKKQQQDRMMLTWMESLHPLIEMRCSALSPQDKENVDTIPPISGEALVDLFINDMSSIRETNTVHADEAKFPFFLQLALREQAVQMMRILPLFASGQQLAFLCGAYPAVLSSYQPDNTHLNNYKVDENLAVTLFAKLRNQVRLNADCVNRVTLSRGDRLLLDVFVTEDNLRVVSGDQNFVVPEHWGSNEDDLTKTLSAKGVRWLLHCQKEGVATYALWQAVFYHLSAYQILYLLYQPAIGAYTNNDEDMRNYAISTFLAQNPAALEKCLSQIDPAYYQPDGDYSAQREQLLALANQALAHPGVVEQLSITARVKLYQLNDETLRAHLVRQLCNNDLLKCLNNDELIDLLCLDNGELREAIVTMWSGLVSAQDFQISINGAPPPRVNTIQDIVSVMKHPDIYQSVLPKIISTLLKREKLLDRITDALSESLLQLPPDCVLWLISADSPKLFDKILRRLQEIAEYHEAQVLFREMMKRVNHHPKAITLLSRLLSVLGDYLSQPAFKRSENTEEAKDRKPEKLLRVVLYQQDREIRRSAIMAAQSSPIIGVLFFKCVVNDYRSVLQGKSEGLPSAAMLQQLIRDFIGTVNSEYWNTHQDVSAQVLPGLVVLGDEQIISDLFKSSSFVLQCLKLARLVVALLTSPVARVRERLFVLCEQRQHPELLRFILQTIFSSEECFLDPNRLQSTCDLMMFFFERFPNVWHEFDYAKFLPLMLALNDPRITSHLYQKEFVQILDGLAMSDALDWQWPKEHVLAMLVMVKNQQNLYLLQPKEAPRYEQRELASYAVSRNISSGENIADRLLALLVQEISAANPTNSAWVWPFLQNQEALVIIKPCLNVNNIAHLLNLSGSAYFDFVMKTFVTNPSKNTSTRSVLFALLDCNPAITNELFYQWVDSNHPDIMPKALTLVDIAKVTRITQTFEDRALAEKMMTVRQPDAPIQFIPFNRVPNFGTDRTSPKPKKISSPPSKEEIPERDTSLSDSDGVVLPVQMPTFSPPPPPPPSSSQLSESLLEQEAPDDEGMEEVPTPLAGSHGRRPPLREPSQAQIMGAKRDEWMSQRQEGAPRVKAELPTDFWSKGNGGDASSLVPGSSAGSGSD